MNLRPADFATFFQLVHGPTHRPFPWQESLVNQLAEGDKWPDVMDLPTGSGKTSTLDVAVFHLALRVNAIQRAALRIVFAVDRRLVVDDAFVHAQKIACALGNASQSVAAGHEILKEVARRLQRLAGKNSKPLVVCRLRGGAPLEHDWARTPAQPTILCSTIDQVGSRLLFRGYGVSDIMKPLHAGLLGANSLILLDEAHLSDPFQTTLAAVQTIGKAEIKTVLLSATPKRRAKRPFSLTAGDYKNPVLKIRLNAPKPTQLISIDNTSKDSFVKIARNMAERLQKSGVLVPAVGVIVNRVGLARDIFNELNCDAVFNAVLMIGRSRDIDRDKLVAQLKPFRPNADNRSEARPLFIVATQCLEVGVDLDLDGLVTQAASFDALRQRFGRLNRTGREIPAEGAILAVRQDILPKADDPVYGNRIHLTWEALNKISNAGKVNFGITSLEGRLKDSGIDVAALAAPLTEDPVVMPAYMELWSQTSPRPASTPEVGLFLHGVERAPGEVSIVWRSDVSSSDMQEGVTLQKIDFAMLLKLVPPRAAEMIQVPLWAARAWLRQPSSSLKELGNIPDTPGREEGEAIALHDHFRERQVFRWAGTDDPRTGIVKPEELRPGDILVVPADYGGCDMHGWNPISANSVRDIAHDAALPFRRRRYAVRIARDVAHWGHISSILANEGLARSDNLIDHLLDALPSSETISLDNEKNNNSSSRSLREPLEALRHKRGRVSVHFPYSGGHKNGVVIVAERGIGGDDIAPDTPEPTSEDNDLSYRSKEPISIDSHCARVSKLVQEYTEALGITQELIRDLCLSAFLHDIGKADRRFQMMLSGGNPWNRPDGPALAKSGRPSSKGARELAGLPRGWRHEALSVRMAQMHPRFLNAHDPELVLWLIGTHHGRGRPLFDFCDPLAEAPEQNILPCLSINMWPLTPQQPGPQSLAFDFNDADWPHLFVVLKQRYGIWGLAHLEAILRLADHRASEQERHTSEEGTTP